MGDKISMYEIHKEFGIHPISVRRLVDIGQLPAPDRLTNGKSGNRHILFERSEIEKLFGFMRAQRLEPKSRWKAELTPEDVSVRSTWWRQAKIIRAGVVELADVCVTM